MPIRGSKNVVQKIVELPPEFAKQVSDFARGRGETWKQVIMHALRRHLKHPPPLPQAAPAEDLPPDDEPPPARGKPGPKKPSKKGEKKSRN